MSARKLLSYLFESYRPTSVVDIGCGTGAWLSVARDLGAEEIRGVDGSYVDAAQLRIRPSEFTPADLELPLNLGIGADLCMCLEVAEHLSRGRAASLVGDLTSVAPVVLFGAAIPGQGGTHHINLQWPSYWMQLFEQNRYVAVDCLRVPFWDDSEVDFWYSQNTFLYVQRDRTDLLHQVSRMPALDPPALSLPHPELYRRHVQGSEDASVRNTFRQFRLAARRSIGRRLGIRARWSKPEQAHE